MRHRDFRFSPGKSKSIIKKTPCLSSLRYFVLYNRQCKICVLIGEEEFVIRVQTYISRR